MIKHDDRFRKMSNSGIIQRKENVSCRKEETGGRRRKRKERERLGSREREYICFNRNLLSFCHGPAVNLVGAKRLLVVIALTCVARGYCVFYDLYVDMLCGASLL